MITCPICLLPIADDGSAPVSQAPRYHPDCSQRLFDQPVVPTLEADQASLPLDTWKMAGGVSISGQQPKLSMALRDGSLVVVDRGGQYIVKPPSPKYAELPANEHVTMRLAEQLGIAIPPCGLLRMRDGAWAYVIRRYDRVAAEGRLRKLQQEDFCQLSAKGPDDKYEGSAELCARVLREQRCTDELPQLFLRFLFAYLCGNGDLHLKNLALLRDRGSPPRLSPAYDQLSTQLVLPGDDLALPMRGKRSNIRRQTFVELAEYFELPQPSAFLDDVLGRLQQQGPVLIARSFLSAEQQERYAALLLLRSQTLAA